MTKKQNTPIQKKLRFKKYRVVADDYCGFEVQVWTWWFPFWRELHFSNTNSTLAKAKRLIKIDKKQVIYYEE